MSQKYIYIISVSRFGALSGHSLESSNWLETSSWSQLAKERLKTQSILLEQKVESQKELAQQRREMREAEVRSEMAATKLAFLADGDQEGRGEVEKFPSPRRSTLISRRVFGSDENVRRQCGYV